MPSCLSWCATLFVVASAALSRLHDRRCYAKLPHFFNIFSMVDGKVTQKIASISSRPGLWKKIEVNFTLANAGIEPTTLALLAPRSNQLS